MVPQRSGSAMFRRGRLGRKHGHAKERGYTVLLLLLLLLLLVIAIGGGIVISKFLFLLLLVVLLVALFMGIGRRSSI